MKVTLSQLINPIFHGAYLKLIAADLPIKKAFELKSFTSKLEDERAKYFELKQTLDNKYATKDKEGKTKVDDKGQFTIEGESFVAWRKELMNLDELEVEMADAPAVLVDDLSGVKFSTQDLIALEPIFPTLFPKKEETGKETAKTAKAKKAKASEASDTPKAANG